MQNADAPLPGNPAPLPDTGPDLRALAGRMLARWYWFVASALLFGSMAYLYIRYTEREYVVEGSLMLRSSADDRQLLESLLENLGTGRDGQQPNLTNEMLALQTFPMAREAVDSCNLQASVLVAGTVRSAEFYKKGPLRVWADTVATSYAGNPVEFEKAGPGSYRLYLDERAVGYDPAARTFVALQGKPAPLLQFGLTYALDSGNFRCSWDARLEGALPRGSRLSIVFNDMDRLADALVRRLNVERIGDNSTALVLRSRGPVIEKEVDLINQLMRNYMRRGLEEKNRQAVNTIRFIDEQLAETALRLQKAEGELESFRSRNKVMDLSATSTATFGKLDELEGQKAQLQVRRKYYEYLLGYVRRGSGKPNEIVSPSAMGIEDPLLQSLIARLSQLYGEKSALQLTAQRGNPALNNLEDRIGVARQELEENVRNIIRNADITQRDIDQRIGEAERQVLRLPETERTLVNLQRRFNLNDNIFTYLMQKRAEAGMARAANTTDARILEMASIRQALQVAPKPVSLYTLALILGLLLPALIIGGRELTNDKIRTRAELERLTRIPIAAVVGHAQGQGNLVVSRSLKSLITEAFRSLRLNLNYMGPEGEARVVGITSSVSGEGKTFTAINLAAVSALAGKRTLLVLADMRKPKNEADLGVDHTRGLSQVLANAAALPDVLQQAPQDNLWVLPSGPVPPNPAELYGSARMVDVLAQLRSQFDYVVVDTPPLGLVSDFMHIVGRMDVNVYLVRHNYTRRPFLERINALHAEGKIPRLALVINDVDQAGKTYGYYGYGYGYGYAYAEPYFDAPKRKAWWRRWLG